MVVQRRLEWQFYLNALAQESYGENAKVDRILSVAVCPFFAVKENLLTPHCEFSRE